MAWDLLKSSLQVHRLIPSRFPPESLFDWADSREELEEIAALEGLTNDRLLVEYGDLSLIKNDDWVGGTGSTPLMAAFTHPGNSRFSDESTTGVYYAAVTIETAIAETTFHRERFLSASKERACSIQMREYVSRVQKELIILTHSEHEHLLTPDPAQYPISQAFARERKAENVWGIYYPSVRDPNGNCVAIFRPPALSIPTQGRHYHYQWDGKTISTVEHILTKPLTRPALTQN